MQVNNPSSSPTLIPSSPDKNISLSQASVPQEQQGQSSTSTNNPNHKKRSFEDEGKDYPSKRQTTIEGKLRKQFNYKDELDLPHEKTEQAPLPKRGRLKSVSDSLDMVPPGVNRLFELFLDQEVQTVLAHEFGPARFARNNEVKPHEKRSRDDLSSIPDKEGKYKLDDKDFENILSGKLHLFVMALFPHENWKNPGEEGGPGPGKMFLKEEKTIDKEKKAKLGHPNLARPDALKMARISGEIKCTKNPDGSYVILFQNISGRYSRADRQEESHFENSAKLFCLALEECLRAKSGVVTELNYLDKDGKTIRTTLIYAKENSGAEKPDLKISFQTDYMDNNKKTIRTNQIKEIIAEKSEPLEEGIARLMQARSELEMEERHDFDIAFDEFPQREQIDILKALESLANNGKTLDVKNVYLNLAGIKKENFTDREFEDLLKQVGLTAKALSAKGKEKFGISLDLNDNRVNDDQLKIIQRELGEFKKIKILSLEGSLISRKASEKFSTEMKELQENTEDQTMIVIRR